jgi:2-dehydropantoate 2-reductase
MKIAIIGSGGVGGFFGAKLAKAGNEVVFLARREHLHAMQTNGLMVKSITGNFKVDRINATDKTSEIGKVDLVILGVKAWQVPEVAKDLHLILKESTMVLPLQNGVQAVEELENKINKKNIIGGLCRIISKIESPGVINHTGIAPEIVFGETNHSDSDRTRRLKDIFEKAEISCRISKNIQVDLWKKFMFICSGGLLAITRSTYAELWEMPETRKMFRSIFEEIYQVAIESGIELEPEIIQKTYDFTGTLPYDSTASMARDIWEGKPSEIEYQNGAVVRLAEMYKLDVPVNCLIYSCIKK